MSQITINFRSKFFFLLMAVLCGLTIFSYKITESKAQTTSLSGRFGCMSNTNFVPVVPHFTGFNGYTNAVGIYNFDNLTYSGNETIVANFNTGNPIQSNVTNSGAMVVTAGPFSGSFRVTLDTGIKAIFVPVNSGNTIFSISANEGPGTQQQTTVCQKI